MTADGYDRKSGPTLEEVGNESQTGHRSAFRPLRSKLTLIFPG